MQGDIRTKPLPKRRLLALMWETGMVYVDSQEPVGEAERAEMAERAKVSKDLSKLTKAILQITMLMGLGPTGAAGQEEFCATTGHQTTGDSFLDDGFSAGIPFVMAGLHVGTLSGSQTLLDRAATSTDRHVHGQSKGYAGRCAEACEASWQRLASPWGPIQHGGETFVRTW